MNKTPVRFFSIAHGFAAGLIGSAAFLFGELLCHAPKSEFFSLNGRVMTAHKSCGEMRRAA